MSRWFMQERIQNRLLLTGVALVSALAWYFCYRNHLTLVYNDAMSHLNMARLVTDNQKPGLAQIGSVWLPLGHLLKLPLIWHDWAWHSGFAGSIVSMLSYVGAIAGIYGIIRELVRSRLAAVAGAAVAALNLNMLYLQSTPLTEVLYVGLFVGSAYFLIRYLKTSQFVYLLPVALLMGMQVMTRYDGWFVMGAAGLIVLVHELWVRQASLTRAIGQTCLYAVPVLFACLLWLGWNAIIFDDPLYFATGPFSARSQQAVIEADSGLITKGNLLVSAKIFGLGAAENIGWLVLIIALLGWALYLNPRARGEDRLKIGSFIMLISVVVFNIIALFLGFSIMNLPQLNWNPSHTIAGELFNVRYGILALPFAAVGVGFVVAKWRLFAIVSIIVIGAQGLLTYSETPISLRDGQIGSSAFVKHGAAAQLAKAVKPDEPVLMSIYSFNPVAFASGLPLRQFIHEGVTERWSRSLDKPVEYAAWIVMPSNEGNTDPIYLGLYKNQNGALYDHYELVYHDKHAMIFKRKTTEPSPSRHTQRSDL